MHHRPVAEIAALAKGLAVIAHHHEPGVAGRLVEKRPQEPVEILDTSDLLFMQAFHHLIGEKVLDIHLALALLVTQRAAGVPALRQRLGHPVQPRDMRQRGVVEHVGVMGFAKVGEMEGRL